MLYREQNKTGPVLFPFPRIPPASEDAGSGLFRRVAYGAMHPESCDSHKAAFQRRSIDLGSIYGRPMLPCADGDGCLHASHSVALAPAHARWEGTLPDASYGSFSSSVRKRKSEDGGAFHLGHAMPPGIFGLPLQRASLGSEGMVPFEKSAECRLAGRGPHVPQSALWACHAAGAERNAFRNA
eukprot:jgi/Botrbrau1/12809/Bobra.117_1s0025.1